jgi:hypothetical protein
MKYPASGGFLFLLFVFEIGSCFVAQTGLKFSVFCPPTSLVGIIGVYYQILLSIFLIDRGLPMLTSMVMNFCDQ